MVIWGDVREPSRKERFGIVVVWFLFTVFALLAAPAHAQNQQASTELAKYAGLDEALFDTMSPCVRDQVKMQVAMIPPATRKEAKKIMDDANKACLAPRTLAAKSKSDYGNEVADSIQKNRWPSLGYGGGYAYDGGLDGAYAPGFCPGGICGGGFRMTNGGGYNTHFQTGPTAVSTTPIYNGPGGQNVYRQTGAPATPAQQQQVPVDTNRNVQFQAGNPGQNQPVPTGVGGTNTWGQSAQWVMNPNGTWTLPPQGRNCQWSSSGIPCQ